MAIEATIIDTTGGYSDAAEEVTVSLPDIPEGVLESFPYIGAYQIIQCIDYDSTTIEDKLADSVVLVCSTTPHYVFYSEQYDYYGVVTTTTFDESTISCYTLNANAEWEASDGSSGLIVDTNYTTFPVTDYITIVEGEYTITHTGKILWSNHDIYCDESDNSYIYFAAEHFVVDGVKLPVRPVYDTETYPYTTVIVMQYSSTPVYLLIGSSNPFFFVPAEMLDDADEYTEGELRNTVPTSVIIYQHSPSDTPTFWDGPESQVITNSDEMAISMMNYQGIYNFYVFWSNYAVLTATAVNSDGTYTVGEEIYYEYVDLTYNGPDRVAIDGAWVSSIADYCRLLTARKQKYTVDDISDVIDSKEYIWQAILNAAYGDLESFILTTPTIDARIIDPWPLTWNYVSFTRQINAPNAVRVGRMAFFMNMFLSAFVAPKLKTIDDSAFTSCALESADYPLLTKIGISAFAGCKLTTIDFPLLEYVGHGAFEDCTTLTTVTLPSCLNEIDGNPFVGCKNLTSITVDDANETYCAVDNVLYTKDMSMFIASPGGLTEYTVLDSITTIGDYAFSDQTSLTSITLPDGLTAIGDRSFDGCTVLASITLPSNLASIGEYAFASCKALTDISLPDSLVTIGNDAFYYCQALTSVVFGGGLTAISSSCFYQCSKLAQIDLPENISSLGSGCFNYCSALTAAIIRKTDAICKFAATNIFSNTPIASGTGYIYVPSALLDTYKADTNAGTYSAQFRALEDYTVDGTVTGELDSTKI